jgi:hypothetical protein
MNCEGRYTCETITLLLMLGCIAFGQDSASKREKDSTVLKATHDFSFVLCVKQLEKAGEPCATNLDHT